ncbi:hypothetical protein AGMMS49525_04900 [Bacteroidia bacterium]|nr:hypothetical protein AGMMS49525_04900 [Bacteroidia bacterium]
MKFLIEKDKDGNWQLPLNCKDYMNRIMAGNYELELTKFRRTRTNKQNNWLWGKIYPLMWQPLIDAGCDEINSIDKVHKFCKVLIGGESIVNKYTGEVVTIPTSTKKMNTVEFCTYCDKCRDYAMEYLGVEIPDPIPVEERNKIKNDIKL